MPQPAPDPTSLGTRASPEVVVVDHYDSYTYNLVHLVAAVTGRVPRVVEHDRVSAAEVLGYTHVLLSPGPGRPDQPADFAVGGEVLRAGTRPVLGVCLGMQGLVTAYGGRVGRGEPAHGEVTLVEHDGRGVFAGLPPTIRVVRYHSLRALEVPDCLEVSAWTADSERVVMGVRHRRLPLEGVQFHPESVLSEHGRRLVANFLAMP